MALQELSLASVNLVSDSCLATVAEVLVQSKRRYVSAELLGWLTKHAWHSRGSFAHGCASSTTTAST